MAERLTIPVYIAKAKAAISYVEAAMVHGADNKVKDRLASAFSRGKGVHELVAEMRTTNRQLMNGVSFVTAADWLDLRAWSARMFGAGNCEEQSAMAFQYLRDAGVRPVDWCFWDLGSSSHAFVILNAAAGIAPGSFEAWSRDAVLCDPWEGLAELVPRDWASKPITCRLHFGLEGTEESGGGMWGLNTRLQGRA